MRFDDRLTTILAADTSSAFGAQSAWRQLVDLLGRGRVTQPDAVLARLRMLREHVPLDVRAATARALALAEPPAALVALFAEDEMAAAAPLLRTAALTAEAWLALLPRLSPSLRAVLRHRRDLPPEVRRGLDSFGATDFVLGDETVEPVTVAAPVPAEPAAVAVPTPAAPFDQTSFVAIGEAARAIPVVAEALKQASEPVPRFEIADLVARIDEYQRSRVVPSATEAPIELAPVDRFRFATDAGGVIRWVDAAARGPLIGVSMASAGPQGAARLDAGAGGALRTRSPFRDVRLEIEGESPLTGSWRLAGQPDFDRATGRFGLQRRDKSV